VQSSYKEDLDPNAQISDYVQRYPLSVKGPNRDRDRLLAQPNSSGQSSEYRDLLPSTIEQQQPNQFAVGNNP
jgi:hypothetical protein